MFFAAFISIICLVDTPDSISCLVVSLLTSTPAAKRSFLCVCSLCCLLAIANAILRLDSSSVNDGAVDWYGLISHVGMVGDTGVGLVGCGADIGTCFASSFLVGCGADNCFTSSFTTPGKMGLRTGLLGGNALLFGLSSFVLSLSATGFGAGSDPPKRDVVAWRRLLVGWSPNITNSVDAD